MSKQKQFQNKPYYMNNGGKVETEHEKTQKFKLGIDCNSNPLVTIDNTIHFFNSNQFHAFTLAIINVNKKVNPEIDYSKILIK